MSKQLWRQILKCIFKSHWNIVSLNTAKISGTLRNFLVRKSFANGQSQQILEQFVWRPVETARRRKISAAGKQKKFLHLKQWNLHEILLVLLSSQILKNDIFFYIHICIYVDIDKYIYICIIYIIYIGNIYIYIYIICILYRRDILYTNVKPVCECVATMLQRRKKSLFDEFLHSF